MEITKRKQWTKDNTFSLTLIVLPALMAGLIAFLYATKWDIHITTLPVWNDEAAYYAQVKMILKQGFSKGYWGFGGEHALLGTGGAWSPAILLPYVLFGKLFGWTYASVSIANVFYLCVANALFLLLVSAKKETCIRLFFVELFSLHLWLYMNTQMSEVLRYAMALVLAGMIYRLFFAEHNPIWFKVLVGLYILYLLQAYIFFSFVVMIYVFAILREHKFREKFWIGFFAMAASAGCSYYALHLISSNYNIFKTEQLFSYLKHHDILGTIRAFIWMAKVGVYDLLTCMMSKTGCGLFHLFVPVIAFFALMPVVYLIWKKSEEKQDRTVLACIAYTMILYTGMYVTVYSLEAFTFFRGMGIPLMFCLALLCCIDKYYIYATFCLAYGLLCFYLPSNLKAFNEERYVMADKVAEWNALATNFENTMTLGDDRWQNTILLYTMEPRAIASLPAGFGQNYMMYSDDLPSTEVGYLLFSLKEAGEVRGDWLEQSYFQVYNKNRDAIEENYFIQYTDGSYVLYKHK